jgi:hypothetical protein
MKSRLNFEESGTHPFGSVTGFKDLRFLAMCLDSLNLKASQIHDANKYG